MDPSKVPRSKGKVPIDFETSPHKETSFGTYDAFSKGSVSPIT
jgi:hypothetical protein